MSLIEQEVSLERWIELSDEGQQRTIRFNLSGHGPFDMSSDEAYLGGQLEDYVYPEENIAASLAKWP
jgi:tryptophan synthase beta chain